jgi:hypothetical protein
MYLPPTAAMVAAVVARRMRFDPACGYELLKVRLSLHAAMHLYV